MLRKENCTIPVLPLAATIFIYFVRGGSSCYTGEFILSRALCLQDCPVPLSWLFIYLSGSLQPEVLAMFRGGGITSLDCRFCTS